MPQPRPPVTYASLCALFTAHLTIAVHTILAVRELYPSTTFLTARAYNLPVKQSRHPGVCAWINDAVAAIETELQKGTVRRVLLVIFEGEHKLPAEQAPSSGADGHSDEVTGPPSSRVNHNSSPNQGQNQNRPLERYVWDLSRFPVIPKTEIHTPFARHPDSLPDPVEGEDTELSNAVQQDVVATERTIKRHAEVEKAHIDVQEQFRGLLSRLSIISGRLTALPPDCTFTLCVQLKDEADPPIGYPQPWIPAESGTQNEVVHGPEGQQGGYIDRVPLATPQSRNLKGGNDMGRGRTVPIRTVDLGEMVFEMWVEEGQAKSFNTSRGEEP